MAEELAIDSDAGLYAHVVNHDVTPVGERYRDGYGLSLNRGEPLNVDQLVALFSKGVRALVSDCLKRFGYIDGLIGEDFVFGESDASMGFFPLRTMDLKVQGKDRSHFLNALDHTDLEEIALANDLALSREGTFFYPLTPMNVKKLVDSIRKYFDAESGVLDCLVEFERTLGGTMDDSALLDASMFTVQMKLLALTGTITYDGPFPLVQTISHRKNMRSAGLEGFDVKRWDGHRSVCLLSRDLMHGRDVFTIRQLSTKENQLLTTTISSGLGDDSDFI